MTDLARSGTGLDRDMATSGNRVDQQTWDRLVEAYRQEPGNHSRASRVAMVKRVTARRCWETGYPNRASTPWAKRPIRELLQEEAEIARARTQLEVERDELTADQEALAAERDREAARQHAINVKKAELELVSGARAGTMMGLAAAIKAAKGLQAAMVRMGSALDDFAADPKDLSLNDVGKVSAIMRRYSSTLRELNAAAQLAMEMERLRLGEPQEIVGVVSELDEMPLQDLVKLAGYQDGVLRRAQERGLVILEGGLKASGSSEKK